MFQDNVVVITGEAGGIDRCTAEKAGAITGENICIDGGMTRRMIVRGNRSWSYQEGEA